MAREAYSAAIMAPLFIAASFLYGLAFTVLVLLTMSIETSDILCTKELIGKFRGLLGAVRRDHARSDPHRPWRETLRARRSRPWSCSCCATAAFFRSPSGSARSALGLVAPLVLLAVMKSEAGDVAELAGASMLFLFGGLAQIYVVIVGAQACPLKIFPGFEASSRFGDGAVASYAPTVAGISARRRRSSPSPC